MKGRLHDAETDSSADVDAHMHRLQWRKVARRAPRERRDAPDEMLVLRRERDAMTSQEWITVGTIALYVGTALISTMPPKGTVWNSDAFYGWFYDFAHMLLNSRPTKDNPK